VSACIHQSAGHAAPAYAVHEVLCRSILNRSRIPGLDYTLNPYVGCAHGCVFCYARFMTRYTQHNMDWGRFVDVKTNAPDVLAGQIGRLKPGVISLSTVTDPYQPVEKKYRITRKLLEMLVRSEFSVHILTRSGLVCRDLDLLKQLPREHCEVGLSMTILNETDRRWFEPRAPSVQSRLNALADLRRNGIRTWVFLAPVMPVFARTDLQTLLENLQGKTDYILVDGLNIKAGNWRAIAAALRRFAPAQIESWRQILFTPEKRKAAGLETAALIRELGNKLDIPVQFCGRI